MSCRQLSKDLEIVTTLALRYGGLYSLVQLGRLGIATMLLQEVARPLNIARKYLGNIPVEVRPNDDSETVDFLGAGRHRIGRQYPAPFAHFVRNVKLVVLLHRLIEGERDDRDALGGKAAWRRALFYALSDGEKPPPGRKRRRPVETDLFKLPLFKDSE
jgi:hypothetical protein